MTKQGFSLVELMVTVAIMAIIASGAMGSFYILGDILRVKQGAGLIQNMIQQADQLALRGEYKKITIHFLPDYLVMEYEPENPELDLIWSGNQITALDSATLKKQDGLGRLLNVEDVIAPTSVEPSGLHDAFIASAEDGWQYQLVKVVMGVDKVSKVIALRHFNIHRENKSTQNDPLFLQGLNQDNPPGFLDLNSAPTTLVIEAPYAVHRIYQNNQLQAAGVMLSLRDAKDRKRESFEVR